MDVKLVVMMMMMMNLGRKLCDSEVMIALLFDD